MIMDAREIQRIINGMNKDERSVFDAIRAANNIDEKGVIDSVIKDIQERVARFFDVIYIDLSIDRSNSPLELSGAGTGVICSEASDNSSNCEISYELPAGSSNERILFKRGKRFFAPYSKIYIYHSAQSGKYLKLIRVFSTRSIFIGYEDDSGEASSSDLVTALGNSSSFATNQVSVGTSATVIKAANTSRKRIIVKNPITNTAPVFIGGSGVTTSAGHYLDPGDSLTLNTTAAIYGIVASGTQTVSYLEE